MARLFGTDGVRGVANVDLTAELALDLAVAAAHVLGEAGAFGRRQPTALVARDPRASGEFLEAAVCAGLASAGVDVMRVGVVPTPAAAYLVNEYRTDLGVMISASHNDMPDNGIKFFSRGGVKLSDDLEDAIEQHLGESWQRPIGDKVGRIISQPHAVDLYVSHLVKSLRKKKPLSGLTVVLDCANGASYQTAMRAFEEAGAAVTTIFAKPDGTNINAGCGSTHPETLQRAVVSSHADMGLAFDGDADRCLAVDHEGNIVDGDQVLAILAVSLQEDHRLASNTVVATVMSNIGLHQAIKNAGGQVMVTSVGDRYVLEAMQKNGLSLGGEQSGHIIFGEYSTTGDGLMTALQLLAALKRSGKTLSHLGGLMTRFPQVLVNVRVNSKAGWETNAKITAAVQVAEQQLGDMGRILVRASGTEPLIRVMAEGPELAELQQLAEQVAQVIRGELN